MDGQERQALGARISERLMKRVQRRAHVGLSAAFYARFAMPDPWSVQGEGGQDASEGGDGMVVLSIRPYLARLQRLAWSRRQREARLAHLSERIGARTEPQAWRRWPGMVSASTRAASLWSGVGTLDADAMTLPMPAVAAPAQTVDEPEQAPQRRQRGVPAPVSASPWLITPWTGARVNRGGASASGDAVSDRSGDRASTRQASAERPSRGASTRTARSASALERVGLRLATAAPAADPLLRAVELAAPALARTARGRRLRRELVDLVALPAEDRVVRVRRALRRAGAARRVVTEEIEAAMPQLPVRPSTVARDRAAPVASRRRGLRPVLASSPTMQAVQAPTSVEAPVEAAAVRPMRPSQAAARRVTERQGPWLSGSPVSRFVARGPRGLSASPMSRGRAPSAAPRRSEATRARIAQTRAQNVVAASPAGASPRPAASAGPQPARRSSARGDDPGSGPSPGDEPSLLAAHSATDSATNSATNSATDSAAPTRSAPVARFDASEQEQAARPRAARASARAVARLDIFPELDRDDRLEPSTAGGVHTLADLGQRRSAHALSRTAQGVYVPASSLGAPHASTLAAPLSGATAVEVPDDVVATPARGGARATSSEQRSPATRASSVTPVASSAPVAARADALRAPTLRSSTLRAPTLRSSTLPSSTLPSPTLRSTAARHAAARAELSERTDSLLPAAVQGADQHTARRAARARPLSSARDTHGTFVSTRAASAAAGLGSTLAVPRSPGASDVAAPAASARRGAPAADGRSASLRAADRGLRSPLVGRSARRVADAAPAPVAGTVREHVVHTRSRPNPAAYAARFGLASPSQVIVQVVDGPAASSQAAPAGVGAGVGSAVGAAVGAARSRAPVRAATAARRALPATSATARPLDGLDLRALTTAAWGFAASAAGEASGAARWAWSAGPTLTLPQQPAAAAALTDDDAGAASAAARATGASSSAGPRALPSQWAGDRSSRAAARATSGAVRRGAPPRPSRGSFDRLGTFRAAERRADTAPVVGGGRGPGAALRRGADRGRSAPAVAASDFGLLQPGLPSFFDASADAGPGGIQPAMPGATPARVLAGAAGAPATRPPGGRGRPDLGVTLGAVDAGVSDRALPTWAQRASGEPLIRREDQFIAALARATDPEEIVRVIYQRGQRGGLTAASTGLPAPVIQVIEQIRTVAGRVAGSEPSGEVRGGPGSDAEVVRRSGVQAAPRSSARRAPSLTALRSAGSASRRQGASTDGISKLSKKLQQLILLAERQRQAARQQVRMAEDSAAARADGHASPTSGEGGTDKQIDIEALGREVLEVVTMELEMRKVRSQEGSDEFGWW